MSAPTSPVVRALPRKAPLGASLLALVRLSMARTFTPMLSAASALTIISAARLLAPITLVGRTALSVLISTKRSALCAAAARAIHPNRAARKKSQAAHLVAGTS